MANEAVIVKQPRFRKETAGRRREESVASAREASMNDTMRRRVARVIVTTVM